MQYRGMALDNPKKRPVYAVGGEAAPLANDLEPAIHAPVRVRLDMNASRPEPAAFAIGRESAIDASPRIGMHMNSIRPKPATVPPYGHFAIGALAGVNLH